MHALMKIVEGKKLTDELCREIERQWPGWSAVISCDADAILMSRSEGGPVVTVYP